MAANVAEPISRTDLIEEVHRLAEELESTPTARDMKGRGRYSLTPYYRAFESWNGALEAAGLDLNHRYDIRREALLEDLDRLHEDLGRVPTRMDVTHRGKFSATAYYSEFDSWNGALREAGFEIHMSKNHSQDDLADALATFADERGYTPTREEMAVDGPYSPQAYYSAFESWHDALEAAGLSSRYSRPGSRKGRDYGDGWNEAKKRKIRKLDNYQCQHCGMTQERHREEFGERLHVHHIIPANDVNDAVNRNASTNLVSLCRIHHKVWEAVHGHAPEKQSIPDRCSPPD
ncbi:homing endonuclease associated repeat-containing protein [Halospeciosus flavus]|uniref:Homing endonuclease associated repeat-containing protein n=1 Tax=Halospeciosus flavus TaxID=3032283 RepID=A0ABD5Z1N8_9EURY|nr:HNH endonuclease [Halospeciosus flavus]